MLRNDGYNFSRIGTFLERADNTARILDVKYYLLLPSVAHIGTSIDNVQWETILRSVSAHRAYHRSEEHTSELQSLMRISYAVFCLKKKHKQKSRTKLT